MLVLNIDNPIIERYFHGNPQEICDLLEAVAAKKISVQNLYDNAKAVATNDKLKRLKELMEFNSKNGVKVADNIDISALGDEVNG